MGSGWDLPMGNPAKTLTMKTSITPGNFIRRRISLMLNKLLDCDVPAGDDIWVSTLFTRYKLRAESRKLWDSAQVHHPKATSLLHQLRADGRSLGAGARSAPLRQWGFIPCQTKLTPSKGSTIPLSETRVWAGRLQFYMAEWSIYLE